MAEILSEMGISPDKTPRRTKYHNQSCSGSSSDGTMTDVAGSSASSDNGNETAEDISIRLAAQKMIEEKMHEAGNTGTYYFVNKTIINIKGK